MFYMNTSLITTIINLISEVHRINVIIDTQQCFWACFRNPLINNNKSHSCLMIMKECTSLTARFRIQLLWYCLKSVSSILYFYLIQITCGRELLKQLDNRLTQAITLYKRRLEWLTTESRRLFGVIEERAVTIVLDIRNMSPQQFDLYRMALERVIYEQVTQIAKFNLIRLVWKLKKTSTNPHIYFMIY